MDENIKLPGSSFEEVAKIIQGYAVANRPVSLDEVSKRIGVHPTIVSRNNGFLLSVGVLEGGKNKAVTPLGKSLGDALGHNLEEEVRRILQQVVESSEFLKNVVGAIRIRRGMDEISLKAHIAYSAGQSKSQGVMTGTGTVVELLRRAGLIEETDGKWQAVAVPLVDRSESTTSAAIDLSPISRLSPAYSPAGPTSISLQIQVRVECTPDQLDGLGRRLRDVVAEFEATSVTTPPSEE
jgi:hypothetical protein